MSNESVYVCQGCGKEYASRLGRKHHMRSCCPDEMVECPTCEKLLMGEKGMKQHHKRQHGKSLYGVAVTCDYCGEKTRQRKCRAEETNYNFCDQQCQRAFYIENGVPRECPSGKDHPRYSRVEYDCDWCGETMMKGRSRVENRDYLYCSRNCQFRHYSVRYRGEGSHRWKGGGENYYGPNWQKARRNARARDEYKCQGCGCDETEIDKQLHVHHIRPFREFDTYEEANRLENLVSLCKQCHDSWEGVPLRPYLSPEPPTD